MQEKTFIPMRRRLLQSSCLGLAALSVMPASLLYAADSHERQQLIQQLIQQTGLARSDIAPIVMQAKFMPDIIRRMKTPYESRTYAEYRPLFVHSRLAGKGQDYLKQHADAFHRCEQRYGVQKEIIAAILGMETRYGANKGNDAVVDSLVTLATGYPRRAKFFSKELGELLLLCKEESLDPRTFKGSYAGAFGTTQFIPSSYRAYAVDADGDGKRNVWDSPEDIINSVANYFHQHGWQHNEPLAQWLPPSFSALPAQGFKHWTTLQKVRHALPPLDARWHDDNKITIIEMTTKQGKQRALVDYNFYVITRWNRSYNYAMAVTELAALLGCKVCQTHA